MALRSNTLTGQTASWGASVADVTALIAITAPNRPDTQQRLVEGAGYIYRYDEQASSGDSQPTDSNGTGVGVGNGWWIKTSGAVPAGSVLATMLQNVATDLGNADINIILSNSHAGKVTNMTIDGTMTAGVFSGDLTGNVTGNCSGSAATVTSAAQTAITTLANLVSVGTIGTGVWQGTTIKANYLQQAAADLGAADVTVNLSNSNGSYVTNLTIDGVFTAGGGSLGTAAFTPIGDYATAGHNHSGVYEPIDATIIRSGQTGTLTALVLQNAPANLGAADVNIDLSNSNGSYKTNLTIDGYFTSIRNILSAGVYMEYNAGTSSIEFTVV